VNESSLVPGVTEEDELTEAVRRSYAALARGLSARYGSTHPTAGLAHWPRGRCQDCNATVRHRFRLGPRLLCNEDARSRVRVAWAIDENAANPTPPGLGSPTEAGRRE
jgi:hypothetical protein